MLAARLAQGGALKLRIEDIDTTRCRPEYRAAIGDDLQWLGLAIDGAPLLQSTRRQAHEHALQRLAGLGLCYPCFCTRADIQAAAGAPHGAQARYPGLCRAIPPEVARRRAATEMHAIRLDAARAAALAGPLFWTDSEGNSHPAEPLAAGDMVLARKDIGVGYLLAAVVDDAFQGISHIVRGRDLLEAVPTQRLLQALLGYPAPRYLHHRLLLSASGQRLAKRDRAETLLALRQGGVDGRALAARLGQLSPFGADLHFH